MKNPLFNILANSVLDLCKDGFRYFSNKDEALERENIRINNNEKEMREAYERRLDKEYDEKVEVRDNYERRLDKEHNEKVEVRDNYERRLDKEHDEKVGVRDAYERRLDKEHDEKLEVRDTYECRLDKVNEVYEKEKNELQTTLEKEKDENKYYINNHIILEKQKSELMVGYTQHRSNERENILNVLATESLNFSRKIEILSQEIQSIEGDIKRSELLLYNERKNYNTIENEMALINSKIDSKISDFDDKYKEISNLDNSYKEYIPEDVYKRKMSSKRNELLNLSMLLEPLELSFLKKELSKQKIEERKNKQKFILENLKNVKENLYLEKTKMEALIMATSKASIVSSINTRNENSYLTGRKEDFIDLNEIDKAQLTNSKNYNLISGNQR